MKKYFATCKVIIGCIIMCLISFSCSNRKMEGVRGYSSSIAESKQRGVFVCKIDTDKTLYKFNDTLHLSIKEAFLEKGWGYGSHTDSTIVNYSGDHNKSFQIVLAVNEDCCTGLGVNWEISRSFNEQFNGKGLGYLASTYHQDSLSAIMEYNVLLGSSTTRSYPIEKRVASIVLSIDREYLSID